MARFGRSQPFRPTLRALSQPTYRRALYLDATGQIAQIPGVGATGLKTLVWDPSANAIKQRASNEGSPIVLDAGTLRLLRAGEMLWTSTVSSPTAINNRSTPVAMPTTTIRFNEVSVVSNAVVTTQWSSFGVSFSGPMYYSPSDPDGPYANVDSTFLATFSDSVGPRPSFTITFASPVTKASFAMIANGTSWFFEALSGGSTVASFTATIDDTSNYFGFEGGTFDQVRVTNTNTDYGEIDLLQFG